jgi:hypothetical protein
MAEVYRRRRIPAAHAFVVPVSLMRTSPPLERITRKKLDKLTKK